MMDSEICADWKPKMVKVEDDERDRGLTLHFYSNFLNGDHNPDTESVTDQHVKYYDVNDEFKINPDASDEVTVLNIQYNSDSFMIWEQDQGNHKAPVSNHSGDASHGGAEDSMNGSIAYKESSTPGSDDALYTAYSPMAAERNTCAMCSIKFSTIQELEQHMTSLHGKKIFPCVQCDASFSKSYQLKRHMRSHTREKCFHCDECDASFLWSGDLKRHKRSHTGEKPFQCDQCNTAFTRSDNLKHHMRIHTGEKPFTCQECDTQFHWLRELKRHMKRAHPHIPFERSNSPQVAVTPKSEPSITASTPKHDMHNVKSITTTYNTSNSPVLVPKTNRSFGTKGHEIQLPVNKAAQPPDGFEHKPPPVAINKSTNETKNTPGSMVTDSYKPQVLVDTHSYEQNYSITNVTYESQKSPDQPLKITLKPKKIPIPKVTLVPRKTPMTLVSPMATLKPQKPLAMGVVAAHPHANNGEIQLAPASEPRMQQCGICDSQFPSSDSLQHHMKTHVTPTSTSKKQLNCLHCDAQFTRLKELKKHSVIHMTEKPFVCKKCGAAFAQSADLTRHIRTLCSEKPFRCDQCPASFTRSENLKRHVSCIHAKEKPFHCTYCDASFGRPEHLKQHTRTHTGEKREKKTSPNKNSPFKIHANNTSLIT